MFPSMSNTAALATTADRIAYFGEYLDPDATITTEAELRAYLTVDSMRASFGDDAITDQDTLDDIADAVAAVL